MPEAPEPPPERKRSSLVRRFQEAPPWLRLLLKIFCVAVGLTFLVPLQLMTEKKSGPPPLTESQREYVREMDRARKSLFVGDLEYAADGFQVGQDSRFSVSISGDWRNSSNGKADQPVHVGANLGVKLRCHGVPATCEAESSERQNVLGKSDDAHWHWRINPKKAGTLKISITVTAYYLDTNSVLFEKNTDRTASVAAKPKSWMNQAGGTIASAWNWLADMAASAGAILALPTAVLAALAAMRRRNRANGQTDSTAGQDDGQGAQGGAAHTDGTHTPRSSRDTHQ